MQIAERKRPLRGERALFWTWILVAAVVMMTAAVPVDAKAQLWFAVCLLAVMLLVRRAANSEGERQRVKQWLRVVLLFLGAYLTARYFFWRTFNTLTYYDIFSYAAALALYAAEIYGIAIYLLGMFVNVQPLWREPVPLPNNRAIWPSVDVLIPTYDEDPDLLQVTLLAATQIRYPQDRLNIYLLDDGGTDEKCNQADEERAAAARARRAHLQTLCMQLGVTYLARERNQHAKAGNINYGLQHSDGELLLLLDADHVPTVDILEQTAGSFLADAQLFLVQTPHFFINPDPIEKNLNTYQRSPSENEMFYSQVQRGLDFWNASFFCGSAAVLRRSHLLKVGGFSTSSVTEDADTSLTLHDHGFRSAYIYRPLMSGLQPETFASFIGQRVRWAQGMAQILLLRNPLRRRGLRWVQRLAYLNSALFWFFGYARLVFLLAPAAYLLLGLKIYDANLLEVVAFALPHVIAGFIVTDHLFGRVRWAFVSELYEYMQSIFSMRAINKVIRNPQSPRFLVTPKGETLAAEQISRLAWPFYLLFLITVLSLIMGVWRYQHFPEQRDMVIITMSWEMFNLAIMLGAIGALLERRQRRVTPRVPVRIPARLHVGDKPCPCQVHDLSVGGARVGVGDIPNLLSQPLLLEIENSALQRVGRFPVVLSETSKANPGWLYIGVRLSTSDLATQAEWITLVHGDSERWRDMLKARDNRIGILQGAFFLLKTGAVHSVRHLFYLLQHGWNGESKRWSRSSP